MMLTAYLDWIVKCNIYICKLFQLFEVEMFSGGMGNKP